MQRERSRMIDPREVAEALRPQVRDLAQELAPKIRRAMAGRKFPHTFEGLVIMSLDGVFLRELIVAMDSEETPH
ncbi:MAG: hypothetical protein K9K34_18985 [Desulfarculaceae bacterium]|nr:hypothetical protein [Desulfarculaceae bacterium]